MVKENPNRWVVAVGAGFLVNLMLGIVYAWSVFVKPLMAEFGWTKTITTLPFTVFLAVFALMMVPAGRLQDKRGPKKIAMIGGVLMGLGLILASFVTSVRNHWWLILTYGVVSGAGCGFGYATPIPCVRKWFPDKPGLTVGLVVMGFGLSALLFAPVEASLIASRGIAQTFLICGSIILVVVLFAASLLRNPPEGWKPEGWQPAQATAAKPQTVDYSFSEMLKTPQFYLLWLMFCFGATAGLMTIGHIAAFAKESGMAVMTAAFAASVLSVANACGRPGAGFISDKLGRTRTMMIVFVLQAILMSILIRCTTVSSLYAVVVGIGFMYGSCFALFPSATGDFFGTKNLGVNYGAVFTSYGVGGIIGPILGALVYDKTGNYYAAFQTAGILCLIAAGLTLITKHPQKKGG